MRELFFKLLASGQYLEVILYGNYTNLNPVISPFWSWVQYPVWQHTFVSPSAFSRRAVVSFWQKNVQEVLVNCLGGLSLPRKSVVRLTDRPDMTLDVYRGRKITIQQQHHHFGSQWVCKKIKPCKCTTCTCISAEELSVG